MTKTIYDKETGKHVVSQGGSHGEDVSARTASRRYYNSRDKQSVYTWKAAHSCLAGQVVFYIKNNDSEHDLVIDSIQCKSDVSCEFIVCLVSGTASGGATVSGVNWNSGSSNVATNSSALENNITGISPLGDVGDIDVIAGQREVLDLEGALRLPEGHALAIMCDKAGAINVNVFGGFE